MAKRKDNYKEFEAFNKQYMKHLEDVEKLLEETAEDDEDYSAPSTYTYHAPEIEKPEKLKSNKFTYMSMISGIITFYLIISAFNHPDTELIRIFLALLSFIIMLILLARSLK